MTLWFLAWHMVLTFPKNLLLLFWDTVGYSTPKMVAETSSELLILFYQTTKRRVQKYVIFILNIVNMRVSNVDLVAEITRLSQEHGYSPSQ